MKTLIDEQIRVAKHNIQKGESILKMQNSLRRILSAYKEHLKLTEKQIRSYQIQIDALEKIKVDNLKLNPKFKGTLIGLSLVLLSPTLTACDKQDTVDESVVVDTSEANNLVTMVPNQEHEKKLSLESFNYNGMDLDEVKGYLSNFINDSLSKGLYADDNNKLSVNEENKEQIAEDFVNLYFYLNTKYLDDDIYAIYNLEDTSFDDIYESSKRALDRLFDDTYTVTPDSKLLLDRLFIKKTDYQILRQMYTLMANRNIASSLEEKEFYVEQVRLNFVHMMENYENSNIKISNQCLRYGLELMKIITKFSSKVNLDDPDLVEYYTKIYPKLLSEEERNNYDEHQITAEELENTLIQTSRNDFIKKIMNGNGEVSKNYQELVKEISDQIRLSSFKPNIASNSEWLSKEGITDLNIAKEENLESQEEKEPTTDIEKEESQIEENETSNEEETNKEESKEETPILDSNEVNNYEKVKNKAIKQAKEDITIYDRAEEDKENIPEYEIPNQPDENCQDKKTIYDYWYRVTFMEERWELVMKQRFGNQVKEPYLSQSERDKITAQAIYAYASELFDTYYPEEITKKTL